VIGDAVLRPNEVVGDNAMMFGNARLRKAANHGNGKRLPLQQIARLGDRATAKERLLANLASWKANDKVLVNLASPRNFVIFRHGKKQSRVSRSGHRPKITHVEQKIADVAVATAVALLDADRVLSTGRGKPTDESQKVKLIVYPWVCHAIRG